MAPKGTLLNIDGLRTDLVLWALGLALNEHTCCLLALHFAVFLLFYIKATLVLRAVIILCTYYLPLA